MEHSNEDLIGALRVVDRKLLIANIDRKMGNGLYMLTRHWLNEAISALRLLPKKEAEILDLKKEIDDLQQTLTEREAQEVWTYIGGRLKDIPEEWKDGRPLDLLHRSGDYHRINNARFVDGGFRTPIGWIELHKVAHVRLAPQPPQKEDIE